MRIDSRFKLRTIAGETLIVRQMTEQTGLTTILSLNTSARMLYEKLAETDFTITDAARLLCETYQIEPEQALQDAAQWVKSLQACHIIQDTPA